MKNWSEEVTAVVEHYFSYYQKIQIARLDPAKQDAHYGQPGLAEQTHYLGFGRSLLKIWHTIQ